MFIRSTGIMLISFFLLFTTMNAKDNSEKENFLPEDIKSVFIYNFTRFFDWPDKQSDQTFTITIFGKSKISKLLRVIAEKRKVKRKQIIIKNIFSIKELKSCNILFVSASASKHIKAILKKINEWPVLVIGEKKGLLRMGLGINFVDMDGRIRFEINKTNINRAGLKVSSQLLKLAVVVI